MLKFNVEQYIEAKVALLKDYFRIHGPRMRPFLSK